MILGLARFVHQHHLCRTVRRQHFVARILHQQMLRRGVYRLVRKSHLLSILRHADERMQEVHGQIAALALSACVQISAQPSIARIEMIVAARGRKPHRAQPPESLVIHLGAQQTRHEPVRRTLLPERLGQGAHSLVNHHASFAATPLSSSSPSRSASSKSRPRSVTCQASAHSIASMRSSSPRKYPANKRGFCTSG